MKNTLNNFKDRISVGTTFRYSRAYFRNKYIYFCRVVSIHEHHLVVEGVYWGFRRIVDGISVPGKLESSAHQNAIEWHSPLVYLHIGTATDLSYSHNDLLDEQFLKESGERLESAREELKEIAQKVRENENLREQYQDRRVELRKLRDDLELKRNAFVE